MKKVLTGLVAAVVLITTAASNLIYGIAEETPISGKCGENATWSFDDTTGVLTISGTGDMYTNYVPVEQWGYYQYKDEITEVVVEKGITSIGGSAFGPFDNGFTLYRNPPIYSKLTKLSLLSSVKSIGNFAFYKTALTSVTLPEGLETIGDAAFAYTSLSGDLNLPKSLNRIGEYAFYNTNISEVNLNEGMILRGCAFCDCDSLIEVTIPSNIDFYQTSTSNAGRPNCGFADCDLLEKVIIQGGGTVGYGVNSAKKNGLGEDLFGYCTSLKEIIIDCDNIEYVAPVVWLTDEQQESGTFWLENNPTFYIYKDSTTEQTLKDSGYLTEENTVYIADFSALKTAISEAENIDTSKYTDESVATLTKAIENARAILEDLTSTQDKVDNAVKAIEDAKKALVEKKDKPSSEPSSSNSSSNLSSSSNPSNSSSNPSDSTNTSSSDQTKPSNSAPISAGTATNSPSNTLLPNNKVSAVSLDIQKTIKKAKIKKVTAKSKTKKKITVTFKKVNKATGYQVQISKKKNFKKNLFNKYTSKKKLTLNKKLRSKKIYYVRVRAYYTYKNSKDEVQSVYSKWSKKLKVKVK